MKRKTDLILGIAARITPIYLTYIYIYAAIYSFNRKINNLLSIYINKLLLLEIKCKIMAQLQVLCRPRLRFKFFIFFLCMCCVWMKRQLKHFESKYRNRNDVLIFESGSLGLKYLDQELKLIHERFVLMAIKILEKKILWNRICNKK